MGNFSLNRSILHRKIYIFSLMGIAACMLVSRYMLTVFQILLIVNYIIEGNFSYKLQRIRENKSWIFASIFILSIIWIFNTEPNNYHIAFDQVRLKSPFIHIPLIIGSSERLNKKSLLIIMLTFIGASFVSVIVSSLHYFGENNMSNNYRDFSYFIFHIYFSLFLVLSIYFLYYINKNYTLTIPHKIGFFILFFSFAISIIIMKSFTAIIAIVFILLLIVHDLRNGKNKIATKVIHIIFSVLIILSIYFGVRLYQDFHVPNIDFNTLDKKTKFGNVYVHNLNSNQVENGHLVNIYISEEELKDAWNEVSQVPYESIDKNNFEFKYTIIRYLTSKGLKKDREGVKSLSDNDINNIEKGYANYLYAKKFSVYARLHAVYWGMDHYLKTGDPNGKSLATRFEAWKAGIGIINNNFWLGVGTGDLHDSFYHEYQSNGSLLKKKNVLGHNTFINVFSQFGIFGFLWFIFGIFYPIFVNNGFKIQLFNAFFVIMIISFISTNGLWHQTEVSFTVFFYALFLFGTENNCQKIRILDQEKCNNIKTDI